MSFTNYELFTKVFELTNELYVSTKNLDFEVMRNDLHSIFNEIKFLIIRKENVSILYLITKDILKTKTLHFYNQNYFYQFVESCITNYKYMHSNDEFSSFDYTESCSLEILLNQSDDNIIIAIDEEILDQLQFKEKDQKYFIDNIIFSIIHESTYLRSKSGSITSPEISNYINVYYKEIFKGCKTNNTDDDGFPLDPITFDRILKENIFNINGTCYNKDSIKDYIRRGNRIDIYRQPISSKDIIELFITIHGNTICIRDVYDLLTNEVLKSINIPRGNTLQIESSRLESIANISFDSSFLTIKIISTNQSLFNEMVTINNYSTNRPKLWANEYGNLIHLSDNLKELIIYYGPKNDSYPIMIEFY